MVLSTARHQLDTTSLLKAITYSVACILHQYYRWRQTHLSTSDSANRMKALHTYAKDPQDHAKLSANQHE